MAPRSRYALAFLGAALIVSSMLLGATMANIPSEAVFDDDQVLLVAENWLSAVEALWVDSPVVLEYCISDDGRSSGRALYHYYPTADPSVGWVVASAFMFEARMKEIERLDTDFRIDYGDLLDTIDEKFLSVAAEGTYCAWELGFNGSRSHFGSDTVDGPDLIPETRWTVSHDYSGEVEWWRGQGIVPFRAKLVFHLWFETERPEF